MSVNKTSVTANKPIKRLRLHFSLFIFSLHAVRLVLSLLLSLCELPSSEDLLDATDEGVPMLPSCLLNVTWHLYSLAVHYAHMRPSPREPFLTRPSGYHGNFGISRCLLQVHNDAGGEDKNKWFILNSICWSINGKQFILGYNFDQINR